MREEDLQKIMDAMEDVYDFVLNSYDSYIMPHDYGNGEKMNMAQIHTLSLIADNPGISVSGVSEMWHRTLSAASQNINKLVEKKLVEKRKENGDGKTIHLYATPEGCELAKMHEAYDRRKLTVTAKKLLSEHTMQELETALSVLQTGRRIVEEEKSK